MYMQQHLYNSTTRCNPAALYEFTDICVDVYICIYINICMHICIHLCAEAVACTRPQ